MQQIRVERPLESPQGVRRAVSTIRTLSSQALVRVPTPWSRDRFTPAVPSSETADLVRRFRRDGVVLLPSYLQGEALTRAQRAFGDLMEGTPEWDDVPDAKYNGDFFCHDPAFLDAALDERLLAVAAGYYRKPFYLWRADASRLEPSAPQRYGSFQWHHDTRAKQVKFIFLLTDVAEDGQRMKYLRGSHRRFYTYDRMYGPGSRYEQDFQRRPPRPEDVVDVVGPAGTVAVFDTNGLHSGNRNGGARRDTLIFYYSPGRSSMRLSYPRAQVDALPTRLRRIVTDNPDHALV